ncbi:MAG: hypothetical protein KDK08_26700 [Rhizobiaceae bacterium]|nr:hypothetical protein [Rhizobiaceae bacterium]
MREKTENPVALAGADRAVVKLPGGKDDIDIGTGIQQDRQARHILKVYAISRPVALAIAEHVFGTGRRA